MSKRLPGYCPLRDDGRGNGRDFNSGTSMRYRSNGVSSHQWRIRLGIVGLKGSKGAWCMEPLISEEPHHYCHTERVEGRHTYAAEEAKSMRSHMDGKLGGYELLSLSQWLSSGIIMTGVSSASAFELSLPCCGDGASFRETPAPPPPPFRGHGYVFGGGGTKLMAPPFPSIPPFTLVSLLLPLPPPPGSQIAPACDDNRKPGHR